MMEISILTPMYNEEMNVNPFYEKVTKVLKELNKSYEIVFVDDGSRDSTLKKLKELHSNDPNVKVVSLRKNFGKAAALAAGFEQVKGDIVITMDGDLQDEPGEIPKFLDKMKEGYDLVTGWKTNKHKGSLKRLPSLIFNKLSSKMTKVYIHDFNCPFKAYKNEVIKDINLYGEMHRYIPVLAHWKGYKIAEIKVLNYPRKAGKSKFGSTRLLKGFFDLVTVKYLSSFRSRPLHLFGTLGVLFSSIGVISSIYLFVQWLMGIGIGKRPLLMFAVLMVMIGIQFISIGLLGEMIANNEEKKTKSYSVKEILE
ncbi:MAG: glycosyltransferase family 2 protein [Nanoarchaeota archaeon]|nr:glycosyltransferase family 2 protein [Nanoarchaeota archaeon]MBU4456410.1 glycosyltransferase family 2 protein [Nanoarchaeota archaeon]